uniref:Large ribosomal subunit protein uL29 n=1 Tax=Megaselia scalaris TaxID=36166 RepID=T1H4S4_MEGSC
MVKVKCSDFRTKDKKELTKELQELRTELLSLRVAKITRGTPSKLSKIRLVRKAIAGIQIIMNQQRKRKLHKLYMSKKYKPFELNRKKTSAMLKALSTNYANRRTLKEIRKRSIIQRKYALV